MSDVTEKELSDFDDCIRECDDINEQKKTNRKLLEQIEQIKKENKRLIEILGFALPHIKRMKKTIHLEFCTGKKKCCKKENNLIQTIEKALKDKQE